MRLKAYVSFSETWENPNVAAHALGNCCDGGSRLLHTLQLSASVLDRRAFCRICRCGYGLRALLGAKKSMGSHQCRVVGGNWYVGRCNGKALGRLTQKVTTGHCVVLIAPPLGANSRASLFARHRMPRRPHRRALGIFHDHSTSQPFCARGRAHSANTLPAVPIEVWNLGFPWTLDPGPRAL
jgi:hypothetical protein